MAVLFDVVIAHTSAFSRPLNPGLLLTPTLASLVRIAFRYSLRERLPSTRRLNIPSVVIWDVLASAPKPTLNPAGIFAFEGRFPLSFLLFSLPPLDSKIDGKRKEHP